VQICRNAQDRRLCVSHSYSSSPSVCCPLTPSSNINVFGLAFVSTFAVVVTICNMFMLRIAIMLSRFRRALGPKLDRWTQDGIFQLQRRAFEADGQMYWRDIESEIPTTARDALLSELPVVTRVIEGQARKSEGAQLEDTASTLKGSSISK
jgi:hypothetical protein